MLNRALLAAAVALSLATSSLQAQSSQKAQRVGVVAGATSTVLPVLAYALPRRLVGVAVERRFAQKAEELPGLVEELAATGAIVIIADSGAAVLAAAAHRSRLPIVGVWVQRAGEQATAPASGVTGVALPRVNRQRLEVLQALLPGLALVAAVRNPGETEEWQDIEEAARALGVRVMPLEHPGTSADSALKELQSAGAQAVLIPDASPRSAITSLQAAQTRLPILYPQGYWVRATDQGLIGYGIDGIEVNDRVAAMAARILKGASPASIPAEMIDKRELVINRRKAREIGLAIPPALAKRATEFVH